MTQPKIEGVGHGKPVMPFGSDGTDWYALLIDALGHLQVDVVSAALGSGGATETTLASALTALQLIDDLRAALGSVNTDDLQVDVKTSALPTGAATQTTLASCLTSLQIIDDLKNALGSIGTDRLLVDPLTYPGSNALGNFPFGYNGTYQQVATVTDTGAGEYQAVGATVPTGEIWIVTHISCRHNSTASIVLDVDLHGDNTVRIFGNRTLSQYIIDGKQGVWVLKAGNYITADFVTLGTGKIGYLNLIGYKMKVA